MTAATTPGTTAATTAGTTAATITATVTATVPWAPDSPSAEGSLGGGGGRPGRGRRGRGRGRASVGASARARASASAAAAAAAAVRAPTSVRRVGHGLLAALVLVGAWEVMATTLFAGRHVLPAPNLVATQLVRDHLYGAAAVTTLWEAARGWAVGSAVALALAIGCVLFPPLERSLTRLAVVTYCVPTIAVGPILVILFSLDTTKVLMAALSVFFVTLTGLLVGLRSSPKAVLDYVQSCGASRWSTLTKVRLRAAVPAAVAGFAIAAPAAILGAILGDYLGGTQGLGVVMLQAEEALNVSRVWAVGLVATAMSAAFFALTNLAGRRLAPEVDGAVADADLGRSMSRRRRTIKVRWQRVAVIIVARLASLVAVASGIVALWWLLIVLAHLDPYFAKSPLDVWRALNVRTLGVTNSHALLSALNVTLEHAALGLVVGSGAAAVVAAGISLSPTVEASVMPTVIMLRSVPLVAMTPVLALVFGTGAAVVIATASIVTFVPSVVTLSAGLRATPTASLDLFRVYGSSRRHTLTKLRAQYALPAVCASARVAVPGAILGAVLAEWLLAGSGVGHLMAVSIIGSNFNLLWGSVAAITLVSVALYQLATEVEQALVSRSAG